jgi:hypothetical protein
VSAGKEECNNLEGIGEKIEQLTYITAKKGIDKIKPPHNKKL